MRESSGSALVTPGYPSGYHFPHMFGKSTGTDFVDRYSLHHEFPFSYFSLAMLDERVSRRSTSVFFLATFDEYFATFDDARELPK